MDLRYAPLTKKNFKRNQSQALFLHLTFQLMDLMLMKQKLARPGGAQIDMMGIAVWRYVHVIKEDFPALDPREAVLQAGFPHAQRFYLRPLEDYPRLIRIENMVVVPC